MQSDRIRRNEAQMNKKMNSCPSNETFEKAFFSSLTDEEQEAFIDHIFSCHKCRIKFEALESLGRQLRPKESDFSDEPLTNAETKAVHKMARQQIGEILGRKEPSVSFIYRYRTAWITAACFVVLIITGMLILNPFSQKSVFRDTVNNDFRLLEPKGILKSPPIEFQWTPYPNAESYIFKLVDENLRTVIRTSNPAEIQALKDDANKIFERGKYYFWSVEARSDDGIVLAVAREYFIIKTPAP